MVLTPLWRKLSRKLRILVALLALSALALTIPTSRALLDEWSKSEERVAFERPLSQFLDQACPGSRIQVLETYPLRIVGTLNCSPERSAELEGALRRLCEIEPGRGDSLLLIPGHVPHSLNLGTQLLLVGLLGLVPALLLMQQIACWLMQVVVPCLRFSPAVALAGVLCLGWPLWSLVPSLLILLALLPRSKPAPEVGPIENGLEDAAVLLMSLSPEVAAECFKSIGTDAMHEITRVISKLPKNSPVHRSQVWARFERHLGVVRRRLGVKASGKPDPDLIVRTLTDFYLPAAPPPKPTVFVDMNSANRVQFVQRRSRRKIFSCPTCDEVFIDEDSLRRHEKAAHGTQSFAPAPKPAHGPPSSAPAPKPARKWPKKPLVWLAAWALFAVAFQLPHQRVQHIALPNALPNAQTAEHLAAISRLAGIDSVLFEGPSTSLVALRGDIGQMQPLMQSAGLGLAQVMRLPATDPRLWTWLPLALSLGWFAYKARPRRAPATAAPPPPPPVVEQPVEKQPEGLASLIEVDLLSVHLGRGLLGLVDPNQGQELVERVTAIQRHMAYELGLLVPAIKFRDNLGLKPNDYTILINDCVVARGTIRINQFLAIGPDDKLKQLPGEITPDPTYQMPGKWTCPSRRGDAERLGCMLFDPVSVVATQLTEMIRRHAPQVLSVAEVGRRLEAENVSLLARELSAKGADVIVVWKVLRGLLKEGVCIRDMVTILESMAEQVHLTQEAELLTEFARIGLSNAISHDLGEGRSQLNVITLDPEVEKVVTGAISNVAPLSLELDPELGWEIHQSIAAQIQTVQDRGLQPIILTSPPLRPRLFKLLQRSFPRIKVISWNEIAPDYTVNSIGMASI